MQEQSPTVAKDATPIVIDDTPKDPIAEQALLHIYEGKSLTESADLQGLGKTTLVRHLMSTPALEERYARSLVCKGVLYAEEMVQVARDLSSESNQADIAKARLLSDNLKWTASRFWQHLTPDTVQKSGLSVSVNAANSTQPLVIQLVNGPTNVVDSSSDTSGNTPRDVTPVDVEAEVVPSGPVGSTTVGNNT